MRSLRRAIACVESPWLLIWGTRDRAVGPKSAVELARAPARCPRALLPEVGHLPFEQPPEVFNRSVLEFLDCPQ
ncbi:MAG TPA: alpha/beta hydrolase [Candidatus Limnocylindrales bacterium]|nr:alpha/beta hydrolase [Candidatus Limnocylindrales bacterium]